MQQNNYNYNNNQNYYQEQINFDEQEQIKRLKGLMALKEKREIRLISLSMGCAIIGYLFMQAIVSLPIYFIDGLYDLFLNNSAFQNSFSMIGVSLLSVLFPFFIMALVNKRRYSSPIIPNAPIKAKECIKWIGFAMLCCVTANFCIGYLILFLEDAFGIKFTQAEILDPMSPFECVILTFSTAIVPALCEELAMRCFSLQLLKKYGKGFSVVAVSIVFGLLHGNVTQFIFAFIIGLVLGYITIKTDSIFPAMITHGLSNGIYVVSAVFKYASGDDAAELSTMVLYIFWFIFGLICLVLLAKQGKLKKARGNNSPSVLSNFQKMISFIFPWMIIPFAILIYMTIKTIE